MKHLSTLSYQHQKMNFLNNYFLTLLHIFHFAKTFPFTELSLLSLLAELLLSVVVASFSLYLMVFVSSQNVHEMCKLFAFSWKLLTQFCEKKCVQISAQLGVSNFPFHKSTRCDISSVKMMSFALTFNRNSRRRRSHALTCVCLVNSIIARLKRILFVAEEKEEIDQQIKFSSFANFCRYPKPS